MNILFLTIVGIESIEPHSLYTDLLREFRNKGHNIYVVSPRERRTGLGTKVIEEKSAKLLCVKVGNLTKCGIIEKGISTLMIEKNFKVAIKKYFFDVKFDLIIYSTPPITFSGIIEYIKKRDNAKTYLLLKDIFPQNAVDLGMLSKVGIKSILYKYFRNKEKKLYAISDKIGCMSQANVNYILKNNPEIDSCTVEICPNCIEVMDMSISAEERKKIRLKYKIPQDKIIFVYGGNLGKPQGISFLIKCLESQKNNQDTFFLIVGDGTEYKRLEKFIKISKQSNVKLMNKLPKEDYDRMIGSCDIGMIFLDYRFTIPNFPSRLLSYMQAKLPVLACTDKSSDIGEIIVEGKFGWWCESNDVKRFSKLVEEITLSDCDQMKKNEMKYLVDNYSVEIIYEKICKLVSI